MASTKSQRQKRRDAALSSLNAAIEAMNLMKEDTGITPTQLFLLRRRPSDNDQSSFLPPFSDDSFQADIQQGSMANKADYVELGLACTDVCRALDRG